jgi:hypothetical protein
MSMRSLTRMAALAGRAMAAKRGLVSRRSSEKLTGCSGSKAALQVVQHHLDHPLNQHAFDGRVGTALDAHRGRAATAAQQHVDDRVDQVGVDRQQAVVVQLLGPEHGQDGRQRDRVQIVAEADRADVVEADLDVVGREVPQAGRHQPHQAVEDDFQHRQALVRDQRRVDDGADARAVFAAVAREVEAQQAVDLVLVQDALGAAFAAAVVPAAHAAGKVAKFIAAATAAVAFTEGAGRVLRGPLGHRGLIVDFVRHDRSLSQPEG